MPKAAKAFIIGVAVLFTLLIIWSLILYFPFTTKVDETYSGFEISLADPEYAQPCEVVINGKYKRYLVKPDFMGTYDSFEGDIVLPEPYKSELEGLELVSTAFTQNRMWLDYSNIFIWDREELTTIFPGDLYTRKNFDDVVIAMAETTNILSTPESS